MPLKMRVRICAAVVTSSAFSFLAPPMSSQQSSNPQTPAMAPTSAATAQGASANQSTTKPPSPGVMKPRVATSVTAWGLLNEAAASDKTRDRSDAIAVLTILDTNRKAISILSGALKDKDEGIRVLAATSLGGVRARASIPALREALNDESPQVAFAAAQALWKMDDRSGRDVFYEILDGERKATPSLLKSKMHEANQDMHSPTALALIGINEASGALLGPFSMGVSMIEEAAKNSSAPIQSLCAEMLAGDDNKTTVDEMEGALSDKNWTVRAAAARALAKLNAGRALPELKDMMLNDKSQPARFAAAAAIVKLDEHPATRKSSAPDSAPASPEQSTRPRADKST